MSTSGIPSTPAGSEATTPSHGTSPANPRDPAGRRLFGFLLLVVVLDAMGIGLLVPATPALILSLSGAGMAEAAVYGGWLMATFALVQLVAGPILGSLSDAYGRRPVLLVSLVAFGLSYVLMGFSPALGWLFLSQALAGLFGATPATAGACLADVTPPEQRSRRFGLMAAAFGTGFIIGPALGGLLIPLGLKVPFLTAAGLSFAAAAYGALALPESLPRASRRPYTWSASNPVGALRTLRRHQIVGLLLGATFLQRVASSVLPAIWPYFAMQQYGWTTLEVGYSLAGFGLATVFCQVWLLRRLERRAGTFGAAAIGLAMMSVGFVAFAFCEGAWVAPFAIFLSTLGYMAGPALAGLLSARVPGDEQGLLQGMMSSLNGVAAVITPLAIPVIFSAFSSGVFGLVFPGAPYLLGTVLALGGTALVLKARK